MKIDLSQLTFRACNDENIDEILDLQDRVIASLPDKSLLRKNTVEMFGECVTAPNYSVGVWHEKTLVGIGILYFAKDETEDLSQLLIGVENSTVKSANYKLCMVDKNYRGNGLQVRLGKMLEDRAKECGVKLLCSTVSPDNEYSRNNMLKLGYTINSRHEKYGSVRDLFYKFI